MADYTLSAKVTLDASDFTRKAGQVQSSLGNMTKSVGIGNVAASIFTKSMSVLGSSVGKAVERVDTLKNFPTVMKGLGYGAADADKAIRKVSESLDGLPTSTDAIVATMQQLAPTTKTIDEAADIALAFNNALLAGEMPLSKQSAALYQYTNIMSTGIVNARNWRSLQVAMPGQLDQVSKSLLGASAKSADLYAAMKDGRVSLEDFNNAILALNKQGLPGLESFEEQARAATGGIGTAWENMGTRFARGVANIIDSIGRDRISGFLNNFSKAAADGLTSLGGFAKGAADIILPILQKVADNLPKIAAAITAIVGVKAAYSTITKIVGSLSSLGTSATNVAARFADMTASMATSGGMIGKFGGKLSGLASGFAKMTPLAAGAGLALAGIAAAVAVTAIAEVIKYFDTLSKSTDGLRAAALGAKGEVEDMSDAIDNAVESSTAGAKSLKELREAGAALADSWIKRNTEVEESNQLLDVYKKTIGELNGAMAESEEDGARLKVAVDKLNEALGTEYEVKVGDDGKYRIMAGDAAIATSEIYKLIDAKKAEARYNAYSSGYEEAMKQQADAAKTVAFYKKQIADIESSPAYSSMSEAEKAAAIGRLSVSLAEAQKQYSAAADSAAYYEQEMTGSAAAMDENAAKTTKLVEGNQVLVALLAQNGQNAASFSDALNASGLSAKQFGKLSQESKEKIVAAFDGSAKSIDKAYKKIKNTNSEINKTPSKKSVTVSVSTSQASKNLDTLKSKLSGLKDYVGSVFANVYYPSGRRAAGGIFTGNPGILSSIPKHADGGILTSAKLTNVGWVGEAGAEAILPLSNRTYIRPLSQSIASDLAGMVRGDTNVYMTYNAGEDARKLAYDFVRNVEVLRAQVI